MILSIKDKINLNSEKQPLCYCYLYLIINKLFINVDQVQIKIL